MTSVEEVELRLTHEVHVSATPAELARQILDIITEENVAITSDLPQPIYDRLIIVKA